MTEINYVIKVAHSCLFKEANHDNVKRSSVPVVAEGWGGMRFVARAPTKKPAKFHPPPTFPSWGKSGRKFRPPNPSPPLTLSDRAEIHKLRSPRAQELIRVISARSDNSFPVFQKPRIATYCSCSPFFFSTPTGHSRHRIWVYEDSFDAEFSE